jgi:hypothetical protein
MDSCTGLSIVTFISLIINGALLIRYCMKKNQNNPALNETMYHTGLFDGNASTSL